MSKFIEFHFEGKSPCCIASDFIALFTTAGDSLKVLFKNGEIFFEKFDIRAEAPERYNELRELLK